MSGAISGSAIITMASFAIAAVALLFPFKRILLARVSPQQALARSAVLGVFYLGALLVLSRPALAAILTNLVARGGFYLVPRLHEVMRRAPRPIAPIGSTDVEAARSQPDVVAGPAHRRILGIRVRTALVYVGLIAAAAVLEPTVPQATLSRLVVFAQSAVAIRCYAIVILAWLTVHQIVSSERQRAHGRYGLCFAAIIYFAVLCVSARPVSASLATFLCIFGLIRLSELKFKYMHMALHAYDFFFFLRYPRALVFAFRTMQSLVLPRLLATLGGALLLGVTWFLEPPAINRVYAAIALLVSFVALMAARRRIEPHRFLREFYWPSHLTILLETIPEAFEAQRRGGVLATKHPSDAMPALPPLAPTRDSGARPNIIAIMNESTFPPDLYQPNWLDPETAAFFQSIDGRGRRLRVETFASASWLTEFAFLTGIPASCYGAFRAHIFHWTIGKFRHALPFCLRHLGYRTTALYPSEEEFVRAGEFYRSVGFDEFLGRSALGTEQEREPDAFYFDRGLEQLGAHFASNDAPAFLFMSTMANHHPHDEVFPPDAGPPMASEIDEYLRRLRFSARDYRGFRTQLAQRFPDRPFLIVHFGDHQPSLTQDMPGKQRPWNSLAQFPVNEIAYGTYFAIDGVNFVPVIPADLPDVLEVGYLGTVILMAAGLPLDPVHALRRTLMHQHNGRLYFATTGGEVALQLNRRLIEAGLILPH